MRRWSWSYELVDCWGRQRRGRRRRGGGSRSITMQLFSHKMSDSLPSSFGKWLIHPVEMVLLDCHDEIFVPTTWLTSTLFSHSDHETGDDAHN
mmetsp:Transcript_9659/g.20933  ORF Transcript_9659/g.20933 Transcript_9659/m.20933 type:complete len:93 (-) Transcript_9659:167-445(-)